MSCAGGRFESGDRGITKSPGHTKAAGARKRGALCLFDLRTEERILVRDLMLAELVGVEIDRLV